MEKCPALRETQRDVANGAFIIVEDMVEHSVVSCV